MKNKFVIGLAVGLMTGVAMIAVMAVLGRRAMMEMARFKASQAMMKETTGCQDSASN